MRNASDRLVLALILSWLGVGIVASIAGFLGWFYPIISFFLIFPLVFLALITVESLRSLLKSPLRDKLLAIVLVLVWLMHFTGVLVPETGFDAVWYHLPLAQAISQNHSFVVLPELYQTLNPLFADAIFTLGFQVGREFGAKLVAFAFGLSLVVISFALARTFINKSLSLVFLILISSFQVISWQVSSFYIDIAKAFFELSALWFLLSSSQKLKNVGLAGLSLGASLASKLFSVVLIPVYLIGIWLLFPNSKLKKAVTFLIGVFIIALPFYLRTFYYSGGLLLSGQIFLETIPDIEAEPSLMAYSLSKIASLPTSLWVLTVYVRDYVTILFLVGLPIVLLSAKKLVSSRSLLSLVIFSLAQYVLWWLIPPISTRYALSGFITLALIYFVCFEKWVRQRNVYALPLLFTIGLAIFINLVPRLIVLNRNLDFIQNQPPLAEYVSQFYDGWIDDKLQSWYQL